MCKVKVSSRVEEDVLNKLKEKYNTHSFTDLLNILIKNDMSDNKENLSDNVSLSDMSDLFKENYELNKKLELLFSYKNRLQLVHDVLIDEVKSIGHTDFTYLCPCCKKVNHSLNDCDCSARIYSPLKRPYLENIGF